MILSTGRGRFFGPTPHGVGGLKSVERRHRVQLDAESHPSRGGWIEIV